MAAHSTRPVGSLNGFITVCEWAFLLAAVGVWMAFKTYHPYMNIGIGLWAGTWVARWLRDGRLTRPTPLDVPLLAFSLSVGVGLWAAPVPAEALPRAFLLAGAVGIYYVVVNSSERAVRFFGFGFLIAAGALGLYFASQHPWAEQPAKFAVFQTIGLGLNDLVPNLGLYLPHPNVVGGIVGLGFVLAIGLIAGYVGRVRAATALERGTLAGLIALGLVLAFGLAMTQSRAMWVGAAAAIGAGVWWRLCGGLAPRIGRPQWAVFGVSGLAATGFALALLVYRSDLAGALLGTLPGPNSVISRTEIWAQVWRLALDTPYTGAGLASFPGLYSTFVLSVPPLYLTHAHNAYLHAFVEQGAVGGLAFTLIMIPVLGLAAYRASGSADGMRLWITVGMLGCIAFAVQGVGDGTLLASRAAPVVFIPAALALAGGPAGEFAWRPPWWWLLPVAAAAVGAVYFIQPLRAQWHANLGALEHNRVALAGWPTNEWDDGSRAGELAEAEALYQQALADDPRNRTALYRLGLIALLRQDFARAASQLQKAYDLDPGQRVTIKTLAYSRVWLGDYDSAAPLLAQLPEARQELEIYRWWWSAVRGRADLARHADLMLGRMQ